MSLTSFRSNLSKIQFKTFETIWPVVVKILYKVIKLILQKWSIGHSFCNKHKSRSRQPKTLNLVT